MMKMEEQAFFKLQLKLNGFHVIFWSRADISKAGCRFLQFFCYDF